MIIFGPEAQAEYHKIYRRYKRESGLRNALRFKKQFARTWDFIDANPQMYPRMEWPPNIRRALLSKFPYAVLYQEISPTVREIVFIVHTKRRPGYWAEERIMEEAAAYMAHCERESLLAEAA